MKQESEQNLSPALQELLETVWTTPDASIEEVAERLHRSPHTVRTQWKEIKRRLNVRSRLAVVKKALSIGLLALPADAPDIAGGGAE